MSNNITFSENQLRLDEIDTSYWGSLFMFCGKNSFDGNNLSKIEYDSNQINVINDLEQVCIDIREKWEEIENIVIYYRLGNIPLNEHDLIIGISASSNFKNCISEAVYYCMDHLKQLAINWKNEIKTYNKLYIPKSVLTKPKIEIPASIEWNVEINNRNYIPPHLIQIKANKNDIDQRIEKFIKRRRDEIDLHNIGEFLEKNRDPEFSCARLDAVLIKRKDAKSHLKVTKVLNKFCSDQNNSAYMKKYIPSNGIDERLENLESQLSLDKPISKNIYKRIKCLEDRILTLEAISPEYIQFWDKFSTSATKSKKRKVFSLDEIDELISEAEIQRKNS